MSKSLYKSLAKSIEHHPDAGSRWVFSESAIVADVNDPERRHRIKVTIPSIDESLVYDDWVSPATPFSFGDGFGSVFLPEIGSEVMITGVLGQKYNFVYHGAVYNEDAAAPDLGEDTQGMKVPKNLTFWAALLLLLKGQNVRMIAEQLAHIEAENIEAFATALLKMTGQNIQGIADQNITLQAGQTVTINGNTITAHSDGNISISATGNVAVSATGNLTLQGRTVNKVGPTI